MIDAPFGPWSPGLDDVERIARLRALAVLVQVYATEPDRDNLVVLLRAAEKGDPALTCAKTMFDCLPALIQRRIIGTFAAATKPLRIMDIKNTTGHPVVTEEV